MRVREIFTGYGTALRVPKGRAVKFRGPSGGNVFYLVKGQVVLHASSHVGRELTVEVLRPGAVIGLGGLAGNSFHNVDATALTDCELMSLRASALRREMFARGDLCFEMLEYAVATLQTRTKQLQELALSNLDARLARAIIGQFEAQGVPVAVGARAFLPTQDMLARMLACSRESVNKELQRLRGEHAISTSRRGVCIVDAKKLARLANFGNAAEEQLWHAGVERLERPGVYREAS